MNSIPKIDITDEMIERARWSNEHLSPETIREALTAALTEPTPLQELIEGALREHAFVEHSPGAGEHIDLSPQAAKYLAARIAPLIAAEARKAQADAWDEAYEWGRFGDTDGFTRNPYREAD